MARLASRVVGQLEARGIAERFLDSHVRATAPIATVVDDQISELSDAWVFPYQDSRCLSDLQLHARRQLARDGAVSERARVSRGPGDGVRGSAAAEFVDERADHEHRTADRKGQCCQSLRGADLGCTEPRWNHGNGTT